MPVRKPSPGGGRGTIAKAPGFLYKRILPARRKSIDDGRSR